MKIHPSNEGVKSTVFTHTYLLLVLKSLLYLKQHHMYSTMPLYLISLPHNLTCVLQYFNCNSTVSSNHISLSHSFLNEVMILFFNQHDEMYSMILFHSISLPLHIAYVKEHYNCNSTVSTNRISLFHSFLYLK